MATEVYSISGDITSGSVDISLLRQEIISDGGIPTPEYLIAEGDVLTISFAVAPTAGEKTALDAVVLAHPQEVEELNFGSGSHEADRVPTLNDDESVGVHPGDIWVDSDTQDLYICTRDDTGNAAWFFASGGGGGGSAVAPGRVCLGTALDYPSSGSNSSASEIQYSRVFIPAGVVIENMEFFLDTNGSSSRFVRMGVYNQADPANNFGVPNVRVAQTNEIVTGPGLDGTFITKPLTNAPTGGSGTAITYTIPVTGWYWIAFITGNTVAKFAVSPTFRADFLPVRREAGAGRTLPATASGLSNPVSAVIFTCAIKEGAV